MKAVISTAIFIMMASNSLSVFDFSKNEEVSSWIIVNDGVMGGLSKGKFYANEEGNGVFEGSVSLENYGGFTSVRHRFSTMEIGAYENFRIRLKGDGKRYQFRVKTDKDDRHTYRVHFETTGEWQEILIPMEELIPVFRGRELQMDHFPGEKMEEIGFLIANKKAEEFRLEIDEITLD